MTILPILSYLVSINIASFFLFGFDKWKAVHDQRRVREAVLFGVSVPSSFLRKFYSDINRLVS